jgi:hypothetical protein
MLSKLRGRVTYGNLVGTLALFIALGGVSYAAVNLPNNSVGSGEIKKNAVKAPEVAKKAVRSPEVKNRSLKCVDLAPAACAASTTPPPSVELAHVVGAPGEPQYENGWGPSGGNEGGIAFYKDSNGIVHIQGNAARTTASGATIFVLPPGYRPAVNIFSAAYGGSDVNVEPDGRVGPFPNATTNVGMGSVSYRLGVTGLP